MFKNLLPKEYSFFDFFEEHASKCIEGARLLNYMFQYIMKDYPDFSKISSEGTVFASKRLAGEIKEIEHEGDRITHHTLEVLHKTFITPLDREEIHTLISGLDDILDNIDATAHRFALYEITGITPEAQEMGEIILCATDQVLRAIQELRTLKNPKEILKICVEIKRLEGEGDDALRKAMARLFRESTDAIYVIKWKEIYEFLEECIDACEDVANIVEGIILEHS